MYAALISALANAAISAANMIKSGKEAKKADNVLNKQQNELDAWYNNKRYEDYLGSPAGQNAINRYKSQMGDMYKKVALSGVMNGASDEAKIAAADRLNKGYEQFAGQLVNIGENKRQYAENSYLGQKYNIQQNLFNRLLNRAESSANAAQNALGGMSGALNSFAEAGGFSALNK